MSILLHYILNILRAFLLYLIHLEFILKHGVRWESKFTCVQMDTQYF